MGSINAALCHAVLIRTQRDGTNIDLWDIFVRCVEHVDGMFPRVSAAHVSTTHRLTTRSVFWHTCRPRMVGGCDTHNGAPSRHNGDGALEVWCRLHVLSFLDPWYLCHPPITTAHSLSHALPVSVPFSSSLPRTSSPALTVVHTHTHKTCCISMRTCGRFFPNYQPACVLILHHQRERR